MSAKSNLDLHPHPYRHFKIIHTGDRYYSLVFGCMHATYCTYVARIDLVSGDRLSYTLLYILFFVLLILVLVLVHQFPSLPESTHVCVANRINKFTDNAIELILLFSTEPCLAGDIGAIVSAYGTTIHISVHR